MATEILTVTTEFTPLDLLIWRRFRTVPRGLLGATFAANPGLADAGPYLPVGTKVVVEVPQAQTNQPRPLVRLWS